MSAAKQNPRQARNDLFKPLMLLDDEPIREHEADRLELRPFAEVVAGVSVATRGPFTVGVYADWGQGKTSVLRHAESLIRAQRSGEDGIVTVWFNAWQYEREEHPIVPLLATIAQAVERRAGEIRDTAPKAENVKDGVLTALRTTARAMRAMAYGFKAQAKFGVPGFGEVQAGLVAKEMIDREETLRDRDTSDDPLMLQSLYFNAFDMMKRLRDGSTIDDDLKIVVFVDDLDRCSPPQALRLLENIKLALSQPGFVFVLAVAKNVIDSHIASKIKVGTESAQYLDKIVQLPLTIPPHTQRFQEFIDRLLSDEERWPEGADRDAFQKLIPLLDVGSNRSPRQLVRLINTLLVDQRLFVATRDLADDQEEADRFLRLAAVARSLRTALVDDEPYNTLRKSNELCKALMEGKRQGFRERVFPTEDSDNKDAPRRTDLTGARERLVRRVEATPLLDEILGTEAATEWLSDRERRDEIDEFIVVQRQSSTEQDGSSQEDRELIDKAIRRELGLSPGEPVDADARASVTDLDLNDTSIGDAGASELAKLANLTTLNLTRTLIGDAGASELAKLTNLTTLYLNGTSIGDAGASELAKLASLTTLCLDDTSIGDSGASELAKLAKLTRLDLDGTSVGDSGASELAKLTNLTTLYLNRTSVGDSGASELAKLANLTTLDLDGTSVGDAGASELAKLAKLTTLFLSNTFIGDVGASELAKLTNLTRLDLDGTSVGDAGASELAKLAKLTTLYLSDSSIGDAGASELAKLANLTRLTLNRTSIGDAGASELAKLANLTRLYLRETSVGDAGKAALKPLLRRGCRMYF